jgi:hypothetical protein
MSTNQLYHTWYAEMSELRSGEHQRRLQLFVWFLIGLFLSRSVHLSHIAKKIPGPATNPSKTRGLRRLLDNSAVRVRSWYRPLAVRLIAAILAHDLPIRLIVDGSKVGGGHQLLMVAVAYRRRALPLAWTWVRSARGHSSSWKQLALLTYVQSLLPSHARVSLVGDCEFGAVPVLRWLKQVKWEYVLRQPGNTLLQRAGQTAWQRLDTLIQHPHQRVWLPGVCLTQQHAHRVNFAAYWQPGEDEPWLLATNLPDLRTTLRAYRKRMWLEEMFGDFKGHGFDLESTHLRHFLRLSRLTLAVVLLYLWLVAYGSSVIKKGLRYLVDRKDRRDLSIFRIGLDMMDRHLTNAEVFVFRWLPYF